MVPRRAAPPPARLTLAALLVGTLAVLSACGSGGDDDGGRSGRTESTEEGAAAVGGACADLEPIGGFDEVLVSIDGDERCLLLAQTPEERARGLMELTDLAGYPGMLFAFPAESEGGFWMRNTPMPLSIAYLDAAGAIVSTADMAPCDDVPTCPSYPASGPYRYTVEVPQGELADLGLTGEARLTVESETVPT